MSEPVVGSITLGGTTIRIPPHYNVGLTEGDRLTIKNGYEDSGKVLWYVAKSTADPDMSVVTVDGDDERFEILTAAVQAYPYSREERIERAVDDYDALTGVLFGDYDVPLDPEAHAVLHAILDAGI